MLSADDIAVKLMKLVHNIDVKSLDGYMKCGTSRGYMEKGNEGTM